MKNEVRVSPVHTQSEASITNSDHQFLSICVPYTELDVFGPGFIEVYFTFDGLATCLFVYAKGYLMVLLLVDSIKIFFLETVECLNFSFFC